MMNPPRTILVPVDFSDCSRVALDYAVMLAAKLDAKLHLLNVVVFPISSVPEVAVTVPQNIIDSVLAENRTMLDKWADGCRTKATIGDAVIRIGDPRDEILQTAESLHVELIVMGTHGRRGLRRALLGSVTELVVRAAMCPVVTVRGQ